MELIVLLTKIMVFAAIFGVAIVGVFITCALVYACATKDTKL